MDAKIKKMRERLDNYRRKIAEMQAQTVEIEQAIKKVEEEQLAYIARSVANNLTGGMDEVFEILRSLQPKADTGNNANAAPNPNHNELQSNFDQNKEGEPVDYEYKTDITEEIQ